MTAGDLGGQAFSAGLVDEIAMDVAPVVLGQGVRFFGSHAGTVLLGDPDQVVQGDRVLHLHYNSPALIGPPRWRLSGQARCRSFLPKAGLLWDGPGAAYHARGSTEPRRRRCSCTWCWSAGIEPTNVVFAALAASSLDEDHTGWSIRKIARTAASTAPSRSAPERPSANEDQPLATSTTRSRRSTRSVVCTYLSQAKSGTDRWLSSRRRCQARSSWSHQPAAKPRQCPGQLAIGGLPYLEPGLSPADSARRMARMAPRNSRC